MSNSNIHFIEEVSEEFIETPSANKNPSLSNVLSMSAGGKVANVLRTIKKNYAAMSQFDQEGVFRAYVLIYKMYPLNMDEAIERLEKIKEKSEKAGVDADRIADREKETLEVLLPPAIEVVKGVPDTYARWGNIGRALAVEFKDEIDTARNTNLLGSMRAMYSKALCTYSSIATATAFIESKFVLALKMFEHYQFKVDFSQVNQKNCMTQFINIPKVDRPSSQVINNSKNLKPDQIVASLVIPCIQVLLFSLEFRSKSSSKQDRIDAVISMLALARTTCRTVCENAPIKQFDNLNQVTRTDIIQMFEFYAKPLRILVRTLRANKFKGEVKQGKKGKKEDEEFQIDSGFYKIAYTYTSKKGL